jgi:cell division transport system permease protein
MIPWSTALPLDGDDRFVSALIAVLVYVASVIFVAMLLVGASAERWRAEGDGSFSIRLTASAEQPARQVEVDRALAAIRAHPEVGRAERVADDRVAALLRSNLGSDRLAAGAPLPVVVEVELTPEAAAGAANLRASLLAELPTAEIEGGGQGLDPALRLMRAIERLALLVVFVLAATLAAAVVFATRARLAVRRDTIDVLHLLGAEDASIVLVVVRGALRTAAVGGLLGFALAVLTLAGFAQAAAIPAAGQPSDLSLSPALWLVLLVLPATATAIAAVTAGLTARRALATMP